MGAPVGGLRSGSAGRPERSPLVSGQRGCPPDLAFQVAKRVAHVRPERPIEVASAPPCHREGECLKTNGRHQGSAGIVGGRATPAQLIRNRRRGVFLDFRRPPPESPRSSCQAGPRNDLLFAFLQMVCPFDAGAADGFIGALRWWSRREACPQSFCVLRRAGEDDLFLRSEIPEEGPRGHIGGVGDLSDRGFVEPFALE